MGLLSSIGSFLGPIGGLIGSALDFSSADSANDTQRAVADENVALQREFAQQGIRWRVEDAKAAGVHPLYALGAQGTSFSPVSVGSVTTNMSDSLSRAGNDISRAIAAKQTNQERLADRLLEAQIRGQEIDNEAAVTELASRRAQLNSSQLSPPLPSIPAHSGNIIPEQSTVMTEFGPMRIPSTEYGQVMENYWPETLRYLFREGLYDYRDSGLYKKMFRFGQRMHDFFN